MAEENMDFANYVELSGFRDIDDSSMAIIKKNVSNHLRRILELAEGLKKLHITLKAIHEREKSAKYEVHAKVIDNGKLFASEIIDRNLFAAIDGALEKILHEMD